MPDCGTVTYKEDRHVSTFESKTGTMKALENLKLSVGEAYGLWSNEYFDSSSFSEPKLLNSLSKSLSKVCTALLYDGSEVLASNIGARFDFAVPGFKTKTLSTRVNLNDSTLKRYGRCSRVSVTIGLRLYFSKKQELRNLLHPKLKQLIQKFVEYEKSDPSRDENYIEAIKQHVWRILFYVFFEEGHDLENNRVPFCKILAACICTYRRINPGTLSRPKLAPPESVRGTLSGMTYMITCAITLRKYKYKKGTYKPQEYNEIKKMMELLRKIICPSIQAV